MEFRGTAGAQAKSRTGSGLRRFGFHALAAPHGSKRAITRAERQPGGAAGGLQCTSVRFSVFVLQPGPECDVGQLRIHADQTREALLSGIYIPEFLYLGQIDGYRDRKSTRLNSSH